MIICFLCDKGFDDPKKYSTHLRKEHHGLVRNYFECKKCKGSFNKIQRLDKHLKICYKTFIYESAFPSSPFFLSNDKNGTSTSFQSPTLFSGISHTNFSVDTASSKNSLLTSSFSDSSLTFTSSSIDFESDINMQNLDKDDFEEQILKSAMKLTLSLHANPNMTRQNVFEIQGLVEHLTSDIVNIIKKQLVSKNMYSPDECDEIFNICSKPFESIKTEYLLKKELKARTLFEDFTEFPINEELGVVFEHGGSTLQKVMHTGVLMPIEFQIKEFLTKKGRLQEMINNRNKFMSDKSDKINHFVQCTTWQKIISDVEVSEDIILLPIGLYSDGMQYNNPLGPHTESTEMVHYFFPCLNDPLNDLNTFLASVVMSKDVKSYGNGKCFGPLVEVFKKLFDVGININENGKIKTVKFLLGNITGDNLAMNAILDYVQSFSANIFCRFCLCDSNETSKLCRELPNKLRTRENYEENLKLANPKATGVSEDCIFNMLNYFHCVDNKSSDLMHDYFEGICRYSFSEFILYLHKHKIMTIDQFNKRITDFCYGKEEMRYIPNVFNLIRLKNKNMKVTAKEMWQFCYLLPIIIGDVMTLNDEMWDMCLCLISVIDLLLGSSFYPETITLIESKVARHNFLFQKHCGKLTPKMHLATHIGTSIRAMGPPRHIW